MASKTESWGFKSLLDLLKDLGPREGERKVYKRFKEWHERATRMSAGYGAQDAGKPLEEWRPPGRGHREDRLKALAAESLAATLELRQNRPIQLPSNRQEECHGKLLNLAQRMGCMMNLQEEQVRIDTAYDAMQEAACKIIYNITRWEHAVSAPDCSRNREQEDGDPKDPHNWEPGNLVQAYHTKTSSPKAVALVKENSPGGDLLLLPSTGGWEAAMSVIRAEGIIEDYPSMLEQPWRETVALRLGVVTRKEKDGRRFKEVTEVTIAPMFGPEFHHYDKRIGISPRQHVENKLELASLPAEAKLDFTAPEPTSGSWHRGHPM